MKPIFVAGSALLDIISIIEDRTHDHDCPGVTSLNFGGVAYNIAVNLRAFNLSVRFMTALNDQPFSSAIRHNLEKNHQIECFIKTVPVLNDQIYNGLFHQGHEVMSVWNNEIEKVDFDDAYLNEAMRDASCVILTNDMNKQTLNQLVSIANTSGIPVFISNTTPFLGGNIDHIDGEISGVFGNDEEINQYLKEKGLSTWEEAAIRLKTCLIITRGAKGVSVCMPDGASKKFDVKNREFSGTTLGAGDLFLATIIKFMSQNDLPIADAIHYAMDAASSILDKNHANIEETNQVNKTFAALLE